MIINCEMCNRPIDIQKEEYQSVLVVENRLSFPKQNHHSFILCNTCYHELRNIYKLKKRETKKQNTDEEKTTIYFE